MPRPFWGTLRKIKSGAVGFTIWVTKIESRPVADDSFWSPYD